MPHMQWIDPSWNYGESCSPEEADSRQKEMGAILGAINAVLGFDPDSPSAKAEFLAQKNYSKAVDKAKLEYNRTMDAVLHNSHEILRGATFRDATSISQTFDASRKVYNEGDVQASKKCSEAEERAWKAYKRASNRAKKLTDGGK